MYDVAGARTGTALLLVLERLTALCFICVRLKSIRWMLLVRDQRDYDSYRLI